jgi:hypothetical protein
MQNSEKLEKSRGILGFAFNTNEIDYVGIANQTLGLASRILGLPYTLITDETLQGSFSNQRYSIDSNQFVQWRNAGRFHAYKLSPYDETLVLDVDYVIQTRDLLKIFYTPWDYLLMRHNSMISMEFCDESMGSESLPFIWATVFAFRKTQKAKMFFELIERIQDNYSYYRALFNIKERNYRNDYAFAIADIILNGYRVGTNSIPGRMLTADTLIKSITKNNDLLVIKDDHQSYVIPISDLHIMSKKYLQSDNFKEFIQNVSA